MLLHDIGPVASVGESRSKRVFDFAFALTAILSLAVLFIAIAIAVRLSSKGPVVFSHTRVGAGGHPFKCLKFRTMVPDAEMRLQSELEANPEAAAEFAEKRKLTNDPRVIPGIGNFLRRSSLDELPQFFNVLRGDMSIVGPRPVTPDELELYGGDRVNYLAVRPGITGAWQTSGRSNLSFDERVQMDTDYVLNWSFMTDLRIIARTVVVVLSGRDAF